MYKCNICNKEFSNKQSYCAHRRIHSKSYKGAFVKSDGTKISWNRGLTKDNNEVLSRLSILSSERLKELSKKHKNPLVKWNYHKPDYIYHRQSNTRKAKYLSGELTPAKGVGRGMYSYVISNSNKWMLRSTYEFILAIYFHLKGYKYEVEKVRLIDSNGKVSISDFNINKRVFEVKSKSEFISDEKVKLFTNNGYEFYKIDWRIIEKLKSKLKQIIPIDELLEKVRLGHLSRNYFVLNLDEILPG